MAPRDFERNGPTVSHYNGDQVSRLIVLCRTANKARLSVSPRGKATHHQFPDLNLFELERRLPGRCAKWGGTKVQLRPDWATRPATQGVPARRWIMPP